MIIEMATLFGGSFTLALSGALMPGPLLTITVAESVRRGFKAGPLLMVGHSLLELALVIAVIHGLGPFLEEPLVMGFIALVGGAILMWFGLDMVRSAGNLSLEQVSARRKNAPHPVLMGVLGSLSNPYWTLWWATIGLGYLIASMKFGILGIVFFFLGHIAADFAWYCFVSFGISRGKTILKDNKYQLIVRVCGVFLLSFGAWFLTAAWRCLA
jgi:threonine/homoserine/homoserine lactone efflux protein